MKNLRMCFNSNMNKSIKKKLTASNTSANKKKPNTKNTSWHFEVEGSGQRKRYLRSLKEKAAA